MKTAPMGFQLLFVNKLQKPPIDLLFKYIDNSSQE